MLKRNAAASLLLAAAGVLTACSGGGSPEGGAQSESAQPEQSASSGKQVENPKNASGVSPCDFLSPQKAESLGMNPEGEERSSVTTGSQTCGWDNPDSGNHLDMAVIEDRSIQSYLQKRNTYTDFAELDIAGYPAVRANKANPQEIGACDVFLATSENQVVSSQIDIMDGPARNDPCGAAQQALEEAVSNIPDAK
ncbi:DUF3558 domain-containing protein [Bounagaea algeriensis]